MRASTYFAYLLSTVGGERDGSYLDSTQVGNGVEDSNNTALCVAFVRTPSCRRPREKGHPTFLHTCHGHGPADPFALRGFLETGQISLGFP